MSAVTAELERLKTALAPHGITGIVTGNKLMFRCGKLRATISMDYEGAVFYHWYDAFRISVMDDSFKTVNTHTIVFKDYLSKRNWYGDNLRPAFDVDDGWHFGHPTAEEYQKIDSAILDYINFFKD